jgi:hypothetical protein
MARTDWPCISASEILQTFLILVPGRGLHLQRGPETNGPCEQKTESPRESKKETGERTEKGERTTRLQDARKSGEREREMERSKAQNGEKQRRPRAYEEEGAVRPRLRSRLRRSSGARRAPLVAIAVCSVSSFCCYVSNDFCFVELSESLQDSYLHTNAPLLADAETSEKKLQIVFSLDLT